MYWHIYVSTVPQPVFPCCRSASTDGAMGMFGYVILYLAERRRDPDIYTPGNCFFGRRKDMAMLLRTTRTCP